MSYKIEIILLGVSDTVHSKVVGVTRLGSVL